MALKALLLLVALWSVSNVCSQRILDVVLLSSSNNPAVAKTAQVAVEQTNNVSSGLFTLNLVSRHSRCDHRTGQSALYNELTAGSGDVIATIGAGCSEATARVAELAALYSLPVVSYSSTSQQLDEFSTVFRTVPSDASLTAGIARFIAAYSEWNRVVIITQDDEQFKLETERLIEDLRESNVSVTTAVLLPGELRNSVTLFPPDHRVFVLNMEPAQARYILCQALSLGIEIYQYVWILQGWYPEQWWMKKDTDCNGSSLGEFLSSQRAISIGYYPLEQNLSTPVDFTHIAPEDLVDIVNSSSPIVGYVYDAVLSLTLALNQAATNNASLLGEPVSTIRHVIVQRLEQLEPFQGFSGIVRFRNGSRVVDSLSVRQFRDCNGTCLLPVGTIPLSGDPVVEFVNNLTKEDLWVEGVPSDGTPVIVENFPFLWLTITSYILATLVIVGAVISMIFTCVFRKRKLVRLTSPNLNLLIAFGVIIFSSGVFLFTYPLASQGVLKVFCVLRAWPVAIGVSLCFGTVNAKMFRIYYIFHNPNPAKMKKPLLDWHLFLIVLLFVIVDLAILIPGSVVESARFVPVHVPDVEHVSAVNSEGITVDFVVTLCDSQFRLYWLCALFGYKAIIQIIGLFFALRIRNIKIKVLNDSKEIAATIYVSSAILAVVVVVSVALSNRLNVYTACYCFGVLLATSVVLIVVFFTKMVRLYKDPRGENLFAQQAPGADATHTNSGIIDLVDGKVHTLENKVRKLTLEVARLKGENEIQEQTAVTILQSNSSLDDSRSSRSNNILSGGIPNNSYTLDTIEN